MSDDTSFGALLRRLRRAQDLTQEGLAERAGCAVHTLRAVESGRRRPSLQLAAILADRLGVAVAERPRFLQLARGAAIAAESPLPLPREPQRRFVGREGPLIGRAAELEAVRERLRDPYCRLLTITGPGGIGKTQLTLQIAHELAESDPAGVAVVLLAGAASADAALSSIAAALGVPPGGNGDLGQRIVDALRARRMLLVLDNLEQLIAEDGLVAMLALLGDLAPGVRILASSRARLGLSGEWVFELGGLALSGEPGGATPGAAELLFAERARQLAGGFALTPGNAAAITQICALVGGTPLAIELASAWAALLSPEEIAAEIGKNVDVLSAARRDAPAGHHSMRAVFERSWQLLSPELQRALAALSLFRGGFTREAAAAVAGAALPVLAELIRNSLLRRDGDRFALHELIRQYSAEHLAAHDPAGETAARHSAYFLELVVQATAAYGARSDQSQVRLIEVELDNLRAALGDALARGAAERGAQLCVALRGYWTTRGALREGIDWIARFLARPLPPTLRGELLSAAVTLLLMAGQTELARGRAEEAVAALRASGDAASLAVALQGAGLMELEGGDYDRGHALIEEAAGLFRSAGQSFRAIQAGCYQGHLRVNQGRLDAARAHFAGALAEARAHADRLNVAHAQTGLLIVDTLEGRSGGARHGAAALPVLREFNYVIILVRCVEYMAAQAGLRGRHELAGRLLGSADSLVAAHQIAMARRAGSAFDQVVASARGPLDEASFAAARAAGVGTPIDEAIALAIALGDEQGQGLKGEA